MDFYSKLPEIYPMKRISGLAVAETLRDVFARLGIPRMLVSDNGKQLISKEVKTLLDGLKIEHHKVTLYAPAQNGLVERLNRVIGEKLKEAVEGGFEIGSILCQMLLDYRSTPHSTTNISPFEAMFGRKMRNNLMLLSREREEERRWIRLLFGSDRRP